MAVTRNVHFVFINDYDNMTLTLTEPATLPISNTQLNGRSNTCLVPGTTFNLLANLDGGEQDVGGVSIVRHNLTDSAVVNFKFYDGANATGALVLETNAGLVPIGDVDTWGAPDNNLWGTGSPLLVWGSDPEINEGIPKAFTEWFDEITARSMEIEITATGNVDIEIGRIVLGKAFETIVNAAYGQSLEWTKESTQVRTAGGTLRTEEIDSNRRIELQFQELTPDETTELSKNLLISGEAGEILITLDPLTTGRQSNEETVLAKRTSPNKQVRAFFNTNTTSLAFEEA